MVQSRAAQRIPGMFGLARVLAVIPFAVFLTLFLVAFLIGGVLPGPPAVWVFAILLGCLVVAALMRAMFFGIVVDGESLRVRQWFGTARIPLDEIGAVYTDAYFGLLNGGGLYEFGFGVFTSMVVIGCDKKSGERYTVDLPATLSPFWRDSVKTDRLRDIIEDFASRKIADSGRGYKVSLDRRSKPSRGRRHDD